MHKEAVRKSQNDFLWQKGERAYSQSEIYSRLLPGYVVVFYQSGCHETGDLAIEVALDTMPANYFWQNHQKIMEEVKKNAGIRKVVRLNL